MPAPTSEPKSKKGREAARFRASSRAHLLPVYSVSRRRNTLILTLLLTSTPLLSSTSTTSSQSPHILPTAVSLLSFLVFGFVFGHLGHYFGPRKRCWWLSTLWVQVLAVLIPGVFLTTGVVRLRVGEGGEGNGREWVVLGLLAAGAGAQVGMVSQLVFDAETEEGGEKEKRESRKEGE